MRTNMQINRPIRNDREHKAALREIEGLMDAKAGTPRGDRLDLLATLVEVYESRRWPIENPDPIEAISFMMEQKGLSRRDLEPIIGGRGRVAEILNRKRGLTLPMIRGLAELLDLPADILVQSYPTKAAA
ncbi:MAG: transcriptional regulator [Rhodospirillales bacterium]|nr:transcriptional regulator [Rhodospirillales bacterium]